MLKHKADLNYHVENDHDGTWPRRVIDMVAGRGNLVLMQKLLNEGVRLTGDTLPCAVSSGNEELVRLLLQHGAEVNSMGGLRISPLAAAIRLQRASMNELIACDSDTSTLSEGAMFQSALRAASEVGDLKWIEYLVHIGGEVRPADLGSALKIAVRDGNREVALALIDAGADTNVDSRTIPGDSPALLEALRQQDSVLVHALLNADADPNCDRFRDTFSGRQPAIELAVLWGDIEIVKAIIRAGADVNICCRYAGSEPSLNIAVQKKNYGLFDLLTKAGCDVNNSKARILGATALKAAVKTADVDMVRYLLAHGADIHDPAALAEASKQGRQFLEILLHEHNARYPKGRPGWGTCVLNSAIESNDFHLFKKLLDGGADANQFEGSTTPFGYAIHRHGANGLKFVEYLLQEQRRTGCRPEIIVSSTGRARGENRPRVMVTAFLAAIGTKSRPMVDLMLRYHADVDFPATYGVKRTPLQRATEIGSEEIIRLLLDKGAYVNGAAAQRGGGTALQFAARKGYIPIARLLLEEGADVDAPASKVDGKTALEGAARGGRLDMVTVLLKAGAALRGTDQGQIARAIAFAEENSHPHISELLNRYGCTTTLSSAQPSYEELFDFELYELE
jgi:ankyrin repeat protein